MTSTTDLAASAVLVAVQRSRAAANQADVEVLLGAVEWCRLHEVSDAAEAAGWREAPVLLGGEGSPYVAEFCVAEFGAAIGGTTDSGRSLLAQALELKHRLPLTWSRVLDGTLLAWKARRIAEQTVALSPVAATYVDAQVAPFAHKIGPAAIERLIDEAVLRFMPALAAEIAEQAAEGRHVEVIHDHRTGSGMSSILATVDTADALDLDNALSIGAEAIKAGGSEDSLNVRRAQALGELARGQQALVLAADGEPVAPACPRDMTLYVHLRPEEALVHLENAGCQVLTKDQLTRWINTGDAKVVIKPVIDLNQTHSTTAYTIPDRIREQVILRDRTCIFPHCNRSARRCDLDHIEPYDQGGTTSTGNLAPLCRRHHRYKTHGRWSYTMVEPGVYLWRSPLGRTYLRDRHGTEDLTPKTVDPPDTPPDD
ncbi:5-methylcytosine-specific restriction endonuclease McrA [Marmoricola sp. OAE513]|uniref:HNH endonuclease signature motif containing protein n=1 Tax=Marmoricola sp. OAE513 TaxID=2817894 RepID=UPI001AE8E19B